jgi:hypothetical protein
VRSERGGYLLAKVRSERGDAERRERAKAESGFTAPLKLPSEAGYEAGYATFRFPEGLLARPFYRASATKSPTWEVL